jgi:Leucine-rich repeat (LRR) protein
MKKLFIATLLMIVVVVIGYFAQKNNFSEGLQKTNSTKTGGAPISIVRGVLDLSGKGLTKVPVSVFARTDIEELNLSNNALEGSLQAEVRHLKNLKVLNLKNNRFTGVPAEVGQLTNLEVLDLSNNLLTGLPYELGNLSKLRLLDISGNKYSEQDLAIIKKNLPASSIIKTQ